jgi:AcrR family transcriptional regulator
MAPTTTPYRRIADDLRRRIESGALPAGARVPSTRALARKWKVANATAAHALQSLVQERLLQSVPRSGTIVAGAGSTGPRATTELTRDRVIAAAIAIADGEGLAALSIRGLAAKLRAPVMSLYRHVRSKEELIGLMTDAALGEEKLAEPPPKGWRPQLERCVRAEWRTFQKHPWLARVVHISRPSPMPNALTFVNAVMGALDGTALKPTEKLKLHVLVHGFVQGMAVNLDAEAQAVGDTGMSDEEHMRAHAAKFAALAGSGRYPYFAKMFRGISEAFDLDFNELFERGLAALLDGFTPLIEGKPRR